MPLKDKNEDTNVFEVKILPLNKTKIMVQIAHEDRDIILDLIQQHYNHSISRLAERIGMHGPNVYNAINGVKTVSLYIIDKIVGAVGYQADLGANNTLILSPRTDEVVEPPKPKSMFDDLPEGTDITKIKKAEPPREDIEVL